MFPPPFEQLPFSLNKLSPLSLKLQLRGRALFNPRFQGRERFAFHQIHRFGKLIRSVFQFIQHDVLLHNPNVSRFRFTEDMAEYLQDILKQ